MDAGKGIGELFGLCTFASSLVAHTDRMKTKQLNKSNACLHTHYAQVVDLRQEGAFEFGGTQVGDVTSQSALLCALIVSTSELDR